MAALTVVTPTGARPEAFAECARQMQAQDFDQTVRWVVVDDGPEKMDTPVIDGWEVLHLRPSPLWKPGQNTLGRNLAFGLKFALGNIVIVEDDDQYAPWWLRVCDDRLRTHALVGESHSEYRHRVTKKVRRMGNKGHASLCSTAFRDSLSTSISMIALEKPTMIDVRIWKQLGPMHGRLYSPTPRGVVGIKGWPGRPGIGVGHRT